jgi:hypothetical protein
MAGSPVACLLLLLPGLAALQAETYVIDGAGDAQVNGYYIRQASRATGFVKRSQAEYKYTKLLDPNRTLQYVDVGGGNMYWLIQHVDTWHYAQLAEDPNIVPPTDWQAMGGTSKITALREQTYSFIYSAEPPAPEVRLFEFDKIESPRVDQVIAQAESMIETGPIAVQHYESALQRMLQVITALAIIFSTTNFAHRANTDVMILRARQQGRLLLAWQ